MESPVQRDPNGSFFLDLLPVYSSYVYPMSPVVIESEIRDLVSRMNSDSNAASFVYSFAAVTLNLTSTEPAKAERDRVASLVTRSLEYRRPLGLESRPTILNVMNSVFTQISFFGLHKPDLGLLYLREAISLLYILKFDSDEVMQNLDTRERARCQRAYWECFVHERFAALSCHRPASMLPLNHLPDEDPSIPVGISKGFNHIIQNFLVVDREFLDFWFVSRSAVTADWIEKKQRQLEDFDWHCEVFQLPLAQQADLVITRHWLRTLTWQIALSNLLLSSTTLWSLRSLSFPLRLSDQLRQFLTSVPRELIGIHGSGMLEKLFEIASTITDVVLYFDNADTEETIHRVQDVVFLKDFVFSFSALADLHSVILTQKFHLIRAKYPAMKELELLV